MTCQPLASDLIANIRDQLKPAIHGGAFLSSDDVYALIQNLNTVHAVAIELEDDIGILQRKARLADRQAAPIAIPALGQNIVRFPLRTRIAIVGGTDGGDAA